MMSEKINDLNMFLIVLILFASFHNSFSVSIHILKPTPNDYYIGLYHKSKNMVISPTQSLLSKTCNKVYNTYQYMGPTSLEPFKNCNENLINYTDKKSYPYCYASIDNFYCYYYMTDNEKENTDCPKKDTIEKILDVIKMCIVTKRSPKTEIVCQSFDFITNKIASPEEFCEHAERVIYMGEKEREYTPLKNEEKPGCRKVSELYNICMDVKTLFPNSSDKDCFHVSFLTSFCSNIKEYNDKEKNICSEIILPKFAHHALYDKINFLKNNICDTFEQVIANDYANNDKKLQMIILNKEKELENLNKTNTDNIYLTKISNFTLEKLNNMTKQWVGFFAELSSSFNIRKKVTSVEDKKLKELKQLFDMYYTYSTELYRVTKEHTINFDHFDYLFQTIKGYIQKVNLYNDEMIKKINFLSYVFQSNQNLTYSNEESDEEEFESSISESEINDYQNDYIKILNYIKRFLVFVNNRIETINSTIQSKKEIIVQEIQEFKKELNLVKIKKNNFLKTIS